MMMIFNIYINYIICIMMFHYRSSTVKYYSCAPVKVLHKKKKGSLRSTSGFEFELLEVRAAGSLAAAPDAQISYYIRNMEDLQELKRVVSKYQTII